MCRSALAVLTCSLALATPSVGAAATLLVRPDGFGDYPTIQEAVDAAEDWDIIELDDGVFTGWGNRDIALFGKILTIRSISDQPEDCVIDCAAERDTTYHRGFRFGAGDGPDILVRGITIRGGRAGGG